MKPNRELVKKYLQVLVAEKEKDAKRPARQMRREFGVGDFLEHIQGLAAAAKKVQLEQQLWLEFGDGKGEPIN